MTADGQARTGAYDAGLIFPSEPNYCTELVTCQGCGAVRDGEWLGKSHACWRNEDGTHEEGGTFQ